MLREWVLITTATCYAIIAGYVSMLLFYQNRARIFHVEATASRFTIRLLPSIIGTLTTLLYTSVVNNYVRIVPYLVMADEDLVKVNPSTTKNTLLMRYYPFMNISNMISHRHWLPTLIHGCAIVSNLLLTPFKSALLTKTASNGDVGLDLTVWALAAKFIIAIYCVMFGTTLMLLFVMWAQRTGLRWDIESMADYCVLFSNSDVLDDYSELSMDMTALQWRKSCAFKRHPYRLGYWKIIESNEIWHGVRKHLAHTPASERGSEPKKRK